MNVSNKRVELINHDVTNICYTNTAIQSEWLQDLKALQIEHATVRKALYKMIPWLVVRYFYELLCVLPIVLILIGTLVGLIPRTGDIIGGVFITLSALNQMVMLMTTIIIVIMHRTIFVEKMRSILFFVYQALTLISFSGALIFSYAVINNATTQPSSPWVRLVWGLLTLGLYIFSFLYYPSFAKSKRSTITLVYSVNHSNRTQTMKTRNTVVSGIKKLLLSLKDDVMTTTSDDNNTVSVGLVQVVSTANKED